MVIYNINLLQNLHWFFSKPKMAFQWLLLKQKMGDYFYEPEGNLFFLVKCVLKFIGQYYKIGSINQKGKNAIFIVFKTIEIQILSIQIFASKLRLPISRSNSQKASEPWLCVFDRVRWKMKNCILSFGFPVQVFWSP